MICGQIRRSKIKNDLYAQIHRHRMIRGCCSGLHARQDKNGKGIKGLVRLQVDNWCREGHEALPVMGPV